MSKELRAALMDTVLRVSSTNTTLIAHPSRVLAVLTNYTKEGQHSGLCDYMEMNGVSTLLLPLFDTYLTHKHGADANEYINTYPFTHAGGLSQGEVYTQEWRDGRCLENPRRMEFVNALTDVFKEIEAHVREHFRVPTPDIEEALFTYLTQTTVDFSVSLSNTLTALLSYGAGPQSHGLCYVLRHKFEVSRVLKVLYQNGMLRDYIVPFNYHVSHYYRGCDARTIHKNPARMVFVALLVNAIARRMSCPSKTPSETI